MYVQLFFDTILHIPQLICSSTRMTFDIFFNDSWVSDDEDTKLSVTHWMIWPMRSVSISDAVDAVSVG
jgi:hypothetical protein